MCDPVSLAAASTALAMGGSVLEHTGTNQLYHENRMAANIGFARDMEALDRQQVQLDQEASESAFDTAIASLRAQGEIAASASSQGLGASSLIRSVNQSMFGIGRNATADEINERNRRNEIANSRTDAAIRRDNQIRSRSRSSLLELGVNLAGDALAGYGSYQSARGA